jgi:hypothetical protein
MADQFRDQVNAARRAGYNDDEIFSYLKDKDPRVSKALEAGYKPAEIVDYLAPKPTMGEEFTRKGGIAVRGTTEAMAPVVAGALGGAALGLMTGVAAPVAVPVGALAGGFAVPTADALTLAYNKLLGGSARLPSQVISEMIPGPRAETPAERVLQASTGALTGTGGSVAAGRQIVQAAKTAPGLPSSVAPGLTAVGREFSRAPLAQVVTAPIATAVGQTVTEATDNPLLGLAAGVGTSMAAGLRPSKRESAPSAEKLLAQSKANYDILDKSSLQFNKQEFNQRMGSLPTHLEATEGYVSGIYPKVDAALSRLQADRPKNIAEITALRKVIGNAASSADSAERRMGKILLDDFDNYILNAPPSAVITADKPALEAWKAARADYAKVKKSELIEDIVSRAEVSQGGKEATIAQGLSALAKNEKKMRFFTPEEQEAIRAAAKSDTPQAIIRVISRLTPMTPAAAIFTAVNPFGAYTAAAGLAAREIATARRASEVNRLSEQMRLGAKPQIIEGPFRNEPVFFGRGVLNMLVPTQQNQNALAQ